MWEAKHLVRIPQDLTHPSDARPLQGLWKVLIGTRHSLVPLATVCRNFVAFCLGMVSQSAAAYDISVTPSKTIFVREVYLVLALLTTI